MFRKMSFRAPAVKLAIVVGLVALFLPLASWATSCPQFYVCIANDGGVLQGSNSSLSITGSTVTQVGGVFGADLGTLSLSTGALLTGSLEFGGTFTGGGPLTITMGSSVIFSGTFSGNVVWTELGVMSKTVKGKTVYFCQAGGCTYTLQGTVTGVYDGSVNVVGATIQQTVNTSTPYTGGTLDLANGSTKFLTPEPGTLGLMGTGLVGIAVRLRRKIKS